mmetsp:Transcript_16321/g.35460  ORF Transcript_16321/g.35460 Transcript_16321/m.35460 type:complete len:89 (+) Transcript_16321:222-488(+)
MLFMNENNFIPFVSGVTVGLFAVTAAMWIVIIALRSEDNDIDVDVDVVKCLNVNDDDTVCSSSSDDDDYYFPIKTGVADGDVDVESCV